ncbi:Ig-like domain-containing protein, partial [Vibrio owensii]|uniref:Ig-like domain-containing protein n=1 Tax=Vibrio owensii TaxID=696485 RepID=UPI000586CF6A
NWVSSDESIAMVSSSGLVSTGNNVGVVSITASGNFYGGIFEDSVTIEVKDATLSSFVVTPKKATTLSGLTTTFNAHASFSDGQSLDVTEFAESEWSSSDPYVASVSNTPGTKGIAKGELSGSSMIAASLMGHSDEGELQVSNASMTSLDITPQLLTTPVGLTKSFNAVLVLSTGEEVDVTDDSAITWSSSAPNIASVSNEQGTMGEAKAISVGIAEISASGDINGQFVQGVATLEVTDTMITALAVVPESKTIPIGLTTEYKAEANLSNGEVVDVTNDPAISWSSGNSDIATISNSANDKGTATGVLVGQAVIAAFAEFNGQAYRATASLEVVEAIVVDLTVLPKPQNSLDTPQIPVGYNKQFTAEATMSDGSVIDVTKSESLTWSSDAPYIAVVSNEAQDKGVATGLDAGTSFINATYISENAGTLGDYSELTVTPLHSLSVEVDTGTYTNTVQDEVVHYIGYARRVMGGYELQSGSEFLDEGGMAIIYIDGQEGKPIEEHAFFFGQFSESPISGALRYKAVFDWPDESRTEGELVWDFEQQHYELLDPNAAKNLLDNAWDFVITVTNEGDE